jgi:hypothetical protein
MFPCVFGKSYNLRNVRIELKFHQFLHLESRTTQRKSVLDIKREQSLFILRIMSGVVIYCWPRQHSRSWFRDPRDR